MGKARVGRRRRKVLRDDAGKIDSKVYRENRHIRTPMQWNRYRDLMHDLGLDNRLATQRGRAFFLKELSSPEFEAGNRWADMLDAYDVVILGRRRSPASPALERLGMGEGLEMDPERVAAFRRRFDAAHAALVDRGKLVEIATTRFCREEGAGAWWPQVVEGLSTLAEHFGLTRVSE